jgi:hypothetical protein
MRFDPGLYGETVAAILALDGSGDRLMPLERGTCSSQEARRRLQSTAAVELFPETRAPEAALAGLYLYFSCIDDAHNIAQGIETPEGWFWHAIVHRQEPDAGNSGYWFRRVGKHPIFPALRTAAAEIGVDFGAQWDPLAFIKLCEAGGHGAIEVQRAEWQLLFDYCAAKKPRGGTS